MVKVLTFLQMATLTQEITFMESQMEKEYINGKMEASTKEGSKMV